MTNKLLKAEKDAQTQENHSWTLESSALDSDEPPDVKVEKKWCKAGCGPQCQLSQNSPYDLKYYVRALSNPKSEDI